MNNTTALKRNKCRIYVKIAGKTGKEKAKLTDAITKAVTDAVGAIETNISVSIEDVEKTNGLNRFTNQTFWSLGSTV